MSATDGTFLSITLDDTGAIQAAILFKAPPRDAIDAGKARAVIFGAEKYTVHRLRQIGERVEFERVT